MTRSVLNRTTAVAALSTILAATAPVSAADLLAYYPFDTDFSDTSGNGLNGTPTNASVVTINSTTKKFGAGAANFANPTGGNDYIGLPTTTFATGTSYALSFWARPTDNSSVNTGGMVMGEPGTTTSFLWLEEGAGGGVRLRSTTNVNADFTVAATGAGGYKDGEFHHVVVQVSALDSDGVNNDVSLYVDGVANTPRKNVTNTSFIIKAIGQGYTTGLDVVYKGQLDEVRIFGGALTPTEINNLYTTNAVPEPTSAAVLTVGAGGLLLRRRSRRA